MSLSSLFLYLSSTVTTCYHHLHHEQTQKSYRNSNKSPRPHYPSPTTTKTKPTNDQQNSAKSNPHQSNNITEIETKKISQMNKKTHKWLTKPSKRRTHTNPATSLKLEPNQNHLNQNQIGTTQIRTKIRPTPPCLHHRTHQTAPQRNATTSPHHRIADLET